MYFLRARYYDPRVGRFITKDPVKGILSNPQTQNPYVYSANNPVNLSDPSGEFIDTAWDIANIVYDICDRDWTSLGVDTASAFIPFLPAGITKVGKVAGKIDDVVDATKQFHRLSKGEIDKLKKAGHDIEGLKDNRSELDFQESKNRRNLCKA